MKLCNTKYFEKLLNLREQVYILLTEHLYFPFCRLIYAGQQQTVPPQTLRACPPKSLGQQVQRFLKRNKIDFMPGYEAHDIKHALLGYRATFIHELRMQYFELGNGNRSIPMWTVIIVGSLMAPDAWRYAKADFDRGRKSQALNALDLIESLQLPLEQVRKRYGIT